MTPSTEDTSPLRKCTNCDCLKPVKRLGGVRGLLNEMHQLILNARRAGDLRVAQHGADGSAQPHFGGESP